MQRLGYYRQYIPGFATIAQPLHRLTSNEADWSWEEAEQNSFELLQQKLMTAPVLGYPDPNQTYIPGTRRRGESHSLLQQDPLPQKGITASPGVSY